MLQVSLKIALLNAKVYIQMCNIQEWRKPINLDLNLKDMKTIKGAFKLKLNIRTLWLVRFCFSNRNGKLCCRGGCGHNDKIVFTGGVG